MSEKPVILITEPERQLIEKNDIEIEINNYDNSHLYYKGFDLGTLKKIANLRQENQQLKLINKEYERLNKENGRGFKITSVKQYNIDELVKCEKNWNKLKEFLENNWKETQDIWFVKIINKMQELERGVNDDSN